ncbi:MULTISPECIES: DUF2721 domain-containing protein [unclassified Sphingopyxis]|uniref:DUF2721 domain-containing protein n=1 Tax=unclassified Sphingopyxis TaxID=2614943 RepID=UPI0007307DAB|nr:MULTISPECIES: DUF2721 domain-containing protein [unclassified Sphingopyxis]KTE26588.1 hypothetical protein ATE61_07660 [Sphingopyxis sp. H057]KTE52994.1 hypothetical protein ATE64_10105 [Sphingopyxis sp. H073]KTE55184.1 hypothetical protein ATE69_10080 [Sphingopyxis sp. H071]KTE58673.1 hypothetical protein ATE66_13910 [Sphingopyxis sp. H107]KTE64062.1 hypothetical protein ATE65_12885 [Sphingopyxis sp. H100]
MATDAGAIAQTIQLSVTPVFLLVATGSLLNVLTGRLSRVVDRSRALMERSAATEGDEHARVVAELRWADRRMGVINNSIGSAVACGIVVCLLVALLFTQAFTGINLGVAASWAFALAMLLLLVSLVLFFVGVRMAIRAIQVPMDLLEIEEIGRRKRQGR